MIDEPGRMEAPTTAVSRGSRPLFAMISLLWSLWLLGQVARDWSWLTGLCFYIPSPAMAAISLVAAFAQGIRNQRRMALVLALMALAPAGVVLLVENRWTRPPRNASAHELIRLVHWNIAYGDWGLAGAERELVGRRASIYVLSELPRHYTLEALAARLGPDHRAVRMGSMAVIATGRLLDPTRLVNEYGLKVNAVTWEHEGRSLKVLAVDQTSDLRFARDPLLQRLRSIMVERRPDLLAGDLNAPRRSRALCPLPEGLRHAYEAAGGGWSYTWPAVAPLYAIDQCVVSSAIIPVRYELTSNPFSDHRMQTLDFRLAR